MENTYALQFTTSGKATISLTKTGSPLNASFDYTYDIFGDEWTEVSLDQKLTIESGDVLYIRGNNNKRGLSSSGSDYYSFVIEGDKVSCSGNIMSLLDYRNPLNDAIPAGFCFYKLFYGCTALTSAPELPATKLKQYCYAYMFSGCSSLTSAPELPATALENSCYDGMFSNCTSLKVAPELPATTLRDRCYYSMFYNCTSLVKAPKLPANSFKDSCYAYMFYNCTSLKAAPKLPKTLRDVDLYALRMFSGCTSLKTKLPMTLKEYCQIHLSSMLND